MPHPAPAARRPCRCTGPGRARRPGRGPGRRARPGTRAFGTTAHGANRRGWWRCGGQTSRVRPRRAVGARVGKSRDPSYEDGPAS
ncbi:MAG: hypothetical protein E7Z97_11550 [Propionibacteriaceae bacterium]|nr:hypothetical protein [Propionibacteriaceae bacterium]